MSLTIRRAAEADAASIAAIGIEVWLNTYLRDGVSPFFAKYILEHYTEHRVRRLLAEQSFWVSENRSGIDGFVAVDTAAEPPCAGCSSFEIATLYVQPRHQSGGKGLGLMRTALDFARASGVPNAWLAVNVENKRAIAFYRRHGFERVGTTNFVIEDQAYENDVLRIAF